MLTAQQLLHKYVESNDLLLTPEKALNLAEEFKDNDIIPLSVNLWVWDSYGLTEISDFINLHPITDPVIAFNLIENCLRFNLPDYVRYVSFTIN